MISCEVVIPLVSEKTKLPWHPNKIPDWEFAVVRLFGGISPLALGVIGMWNNQKLPRASSIIPDPQNRYGVDVDDDRVEELREFMKFTCCHFEQECLYFKAGVKSELLDNPIGWP